VVGAEKIRKIITELTRIRNELRELVGEEGAAGSSGGGGARASSSGGGGGDPLEEILGAASLPTKNVAALEDEDVIVVDVSLPGGQTQSAGHKPHVPPAPETPSQALAEKDKDRDAKSYPKKPPPPKRK
jgi:hypothetical protein